MQFSCSAKRPSDLETRSAKMTLKQLKEDRLYLKEYKTGRVSVLAVFLLMHFNWKLWSLKWLLLHLKPTQNGLNVTSLRVLADLIFTMACNSLDCSFIQELLQLTTVYMISDSRILESICTIGKRIVWIVHRNKTGMAHQYSDVVRFSRLYGRLLSTLSVESG